MRKSLTIWSCIPLALLVFLGLSMIGGVASGFAFNDMRTHAEMVFFRWSGILAVFIALRFIFPNFITGISLGLILFALPFILEGKINEKVLSSDGITYLLTIGFALASIIIGLLILGNSYMAGRKYLVNKSKGIG